MLPKYTIDLRLGVEVEDKEPPEIMFMGLGWHRDEKEKLKNQLLEQEEQQVEELVLPS